MYEPEGRSDAQIEAWLAEQEKYADAVLANSAKRAKQGKSDVRKDSAQRMRDHIYRYRLVREVSGPNAPELATLEKEIIKCRREAENLAATMSKRQRGGV